MEKKYIGITDEALDAGIADGRFSEADIRQIRDRGGRFVKHIKEQPHPSSLLPASVIQVNQVYVYQADLRPVMQAIANSRDVRVADDLSETYRLVVSKLERFLNHRRILDSLNEVAGDAAEIFELRLSPMLDKVDHRKPDVPACTQLIGMLRAQVNIEFIYLLSTFWIDRNSVSRDTGLPRRLDALESKLRKTLEQMLAYQYDPRNGFMLQDSLYGKYLVQGKNGISYLKQFLQHDSRFASYDEFMRNGLALEFNRVLCDLRQLRIILNELKEARTIEPGDIQIDPGMDGADAIWLVATTPQLPKPSSE
ncbi:MAG: hypothetical protein JJK56_02845 [Pseudomonas sp.]|uniref:hypothetical protein n=1 Tax=Pseudomonas sp. TaxID=306 RepID=UPI001A41AFD9|nr:hypothetical protein [Pseudomonas sp.]MBL7226916.1 hypothetical protein [Pseudomonas sp.]